MLYYMDCNATKILKAPTMKERKGSNGHIAGSATSKTVALKKKNDCTVFMKQQKQSKFDNGEFILVEKCRFEHCQNAKNYN
jgi:hypothetical protein